MWSALQKRFASSAGSSGSSPADGNAPIPDNGDGTTFSPNVNHGEPESKEPSQVVNQEDGAEVPNATAQDGVTQAEAITLSWSKASLGAAYILMWSIYFTNAFVSSITGNLAAYITSGFESHSLIPVIAVVSSIMGAATYMPLAKVLNLWDRSLGFMIMAVFSTLGLILSATCSGIATYCAAQVFYSVGFVGMIFSVDVITADTSTLRDRGLAYAFTSSPYIITAFSGPAVANYFNSTNWRWAYGCFAIILPIVSLPMFGILRYNRHKAKKNGLLEGRISSGRTWGQSVIHYAWEFDILGTFLLAAGLSLFLLPFTLAQASADDWKSAYIIVMLVLGIACLIAFALVERYVAPIPFLQWDVLMNRTVLGACLLDVSYQIAYYCWDDYYTSYLQVVYGTSLTVAGDIAAIFDVVSGVWLLGVGLLIRRTGRFRWLLLWSVPLYMLGVGLMIYFRRPNWNVGYSIMCQVLISIAGGTMIIVQQVAVLAAADHNNVASVLAFLGVFGNMGGGVGSSISGAIWTHTLPAALKRLLPASAKADWEDIYDSLDVQLSYPRGHPIRHAIALAYAEAQTRMLIAGTAIMALSLVWMFVIRDIKLTDKVQTKGVLF